MSGVEILFIVVAFISVIATAFIFIKFKSLKFSLMAGLAAIVIILALVLFVSNNPEDNDGELLIQSTPPIVTSTESVAAESPTATDETSAETSAETSVPIITIVPTVTVAPTDSQPQTTAPEETVNPEAGKNSVIYLTFDDGPSPRTLEVLDELKKYNVKATFFIVNFDDSQIPILRRMIDEGHSIAIHGYSHVYADIYKSEEAFMENVTKLRSRLKDKLGYDTTIIRFPGGSSNTISANYCVGIMSKLVLTVENQGYKYFDWNVDSRDAENFTSAQIIKQVKTTTYPSRAANIVLMHDAGDKFETVKSLSEIIEWGIANGYSFGSLNASSPVVHHSVHN